MTDELEQARQAVVDAAKRWGREPVNPNTWPTTKAEKALYDALQTLQRTEQPKTLRGAVNNAYNNWFDNGSRNTKDLPTLFTDAVVAYIKSKRNDIFLLSSEQATDAIIALLIGNDDGQ